MGKAVCAAYKEDSAVLEYFVCHIPNGMTAEEAACLYNRCNLTCYQCAGGGTGFNLTSTSVSVLGMEASSCLVNVWVEGQYVCLAQRLWQSGNTSMFQQIGSFNASKPAPQPTSQPAVYMYNSFLLFGLIVAVIVEFVVILACSCVWCYYLRKRKRKKVEESQCKLHEVTDTACLLYTSDERYV